jgi:hypothetical protein
LESGDLKAGMLAGHSYLYPPTSGNAFARNALAQLLPMPEQEFAIAADGYLLTLVLALGPLASIDEPLGGYRLHSANHWHGHALAVSQLQKSLTQEAACNDLVSAWLKRHDLIAAPRTMPDTFWSLMIRLASVKLGPQSHPFPGDTVWGLVRRGIRITWGTSELNWKKRSFLSLWFLWVGGLPAEMIQRPIQWALSFRSRPAGVNWLKTLFA